MTEDELGFDLEALPTDILAGVADRTAGRRTGCGRDFAPTINQLDAKLPSVVLLLNCRGI